jgi:hypothetical protein
MPLTFTEDDPVSRLGDVLFATTDGKRRILCKVSQAALDEVEGGQAGNNEDRLARFARHSIRILEVASRKYDAGDGNPTVLSRDVPPLR